MKRYVAVMLLLDLVCVGPIGYAIGRWLGPDAWLAVGIASVSTTLNALAAAAIVRRVHASGMNTFMMALFGSMMARMLLMLLLVVVVVAATDLPHFTFTISLFVAYICKSVLEMMFIHQFSAKRPS